MLPRTFLVHLLWLLSTVQYVEACYYYCVYSLWYFWFGLFWLIVVLIIVIVGCMKKKQRTQARVGVAVVTTGAPGQPTASHVYNNPYPPKLVGPPGYDQASHPPPPYMTHSSRGPPLPPQPAKPYSTTPSPPYQLAPYPSHAPPPVPAPYPAPPPNDPAYPPPL